MIDMSKHVRYRKLLASGLIAFIALFASPNLVSAAPYGADGYGDCNFSEGCAEVSATTTAANSDDLSDTGENQKLLLYGALVLIGVGVIVYTIRRKRNYKIPR